MYVYIYIYIYVYIIIYIYIYKCIYINIFICMCVAHLADIRTCVSYALMTCRTKLHFNWPYTHRCDQTGNE